MLKKLKAIWYAALIAFGLYTGSKEPSIETKPPVILSDVRPSPSPIPNNQTQQSAYDYPRIVLDQFNGTDDEKIMVLQGIDFANEVLSSNCYLTRLLRAKMTEKNGLTNQEIYDLQRKNLIKANIEFYDGSWKENHVWFTIGYENDPFDGWTHMNRYFVDSPYMVGDNIIHETQGHSQGFRHDEDKDSSVPYTLNRIYEYCFDELKIQ